MPTTFTRRRKRTKTGAGNHIVCMTCQGGKHEKTESCSMLMHVQVKERNHSAGHYWHCGRDYVIGCHRTISPSFLLEKATSTVPQRRPSPGSSAQQCKYGTHLRTEQGQVRKKDTRLAVVNSQRDESRGLALTCVLIRGFQDGYRW